MRKFKVGELLNNGLTKCILVAKGGNATQLVPKALVEFAMFNAPAENDNDDRTNLVNALMEYGDLDGPIGPNLAILAVDTAKYLYHDKHFTFRQVTAGRYTFNGQTVYITDS